MKTVQEIIENASDTLIQCSQLIKWQRSQIETLRLALAIAKTALKFDNTSMSTEALYEINKLGQ